jgi:uncharacterized protein YozE (UPF0346 family)
MDTALVKPTIYVLSNSIVKKQAVLEVFDRTLYNLQCIHLPAGTLPHTPGGRTKHHPDNLERNSQPVLIQCILNAASKRIDDFYKLFHQKLTGNCLIISIENGIIPIDKHFDKTKPFSYFKWSDICIVNVARFYNNKLSETREDYISNIFVSIDKSYSDPFFDLYYNKNNTEYDTIGKYIAKHAQHLYKLPILHNNWMKTVAGIDRVHQIKNALQCISINI